MSTIDVSEQLGQLGHQLSQSTIQPVTQPTRSHTANQQPSNKLEQTFGGDPRTNFEYIKPALEAAKVTVARPENLPAL